MEQYISKDALIAKIKRLRESNELKEDKDYTQFALDVACGYDMALDDIEKSLNTLKVKDIDLEKEYEEFVVDDPILGNFITNDTMGIILAKHFFELGLKAQEGEEV